MWRRMRGTGAVGTGGWLFKVNEHTYGKTFFLQTRNWGKVDTLEGKGRPSGLSSRWCAELGWARLAMCPLKPTVAFCPSFLALRLIEEQLCGSGWWRRWASSGSLASVRSCLCLSVLPCSFQVAEISAEAPSSRSQPAAIMTEYDRRTSGGSFPTWPASPGEFWWFGLFTVGTVLGCGTELSRKQLSPSRVPSRQVV